MESGESRRENGGATLRLFVAIVLPENIKEEIEKARKRFRAASPGNAIRWTRREQFHLTLKFLGNVAESRAAALTEALREVGRRFAAMNLRAERIGFFPNARRPRVLWVGVNDDKGVLAQFQNAVELAVANFSPKNPTPARREHVSDEKFVGHVTLGRIARIGRGEAETLAGIARGLSTQFFGEWLADTFELIRSELSSAGAHHTTLAAVRLSGMEESGGHRPPLQGFE